MLLSLCICEHKYQVTIENIKNKRSRGERFCSADYILDKEMGKMQTGWETLLFKDNKNVSIISEQIMQHLILFACNANERCMQIIAQHRGHIDKDE